ncbi:MAG: TorD/DmsD family molecular chaperone [Pyrobaculum sp.]
MKYKYAEPCLSVSLSPLYRFVSYLLIRELEPEDLPKVRHVVDNLPEPYRGDMLSELDRGDAYLRLRVDFTKTLLMYVHPYESVFVDPSGLMCTDVSAEVLRYYAKFGYEPDLRSARVRCGDHLGLELLFAASLMEEGRGEAAADFFERHLGRWGPLAGFAIYKSAATSFYKSLGMLVAELIAEGYENLR